MISFLILKVKKARLKFVEDRCYSVLHMAEDPTFFSNSSDKLETIPKSEKDDDSRRRTRLFDTDDENLNELLQRAASGKPLEDKERKHLHHLVTWVTDLAIVGGVTTQDRLGSILAVTQKIFGKDSQVYKKALEKALPYLPSQKVQSESKKQQ